jgi:MFS family permease
MATKKAASVKELKDRTKRLSIIEGGAWGVMIGSGVNFITPYAVALGVSNFVIGLMTAFSTIASSIGQYLGVWWLQFAGSRKTVLSSAIFLQALLWIPIAFLFFLSPDISGIILLILYSLVALTGSLATSAWISIMGDSVDPNERGFFFGKRNRVIGIIQLVSSLAAGYFLKVLTDNVFIGFIAIFIASFLFRAVSTYLLSKHWDPPFKGKRISLLKTFQLPKDRHFNNFIVLSTGLVFATMVASPFISVYMLKDLKFDYFSFSIATVASIVAMLITNPYWGKVIDKYGTRPVLFATSSLIILIPFWWILSTDLLGVVLAQLYSGFVWAGFNLSVSIFLFRIAPRANLPQYSANANGMSDMATFFGASLGSVVVLFMNESTFLSFSSLQTVFLISGILRLLLVVYALPKISTNMRIEGDEFLLRVITVYPLKGVQYELSSIYETAISFVDGRRERIRR